MSDPNPTLSMASLQAYMDTSYPRSNPQWTHLWNVSEDNTLEADFLIQTPARMWGVSAADFKAQLSGDYPGFGLARCSIANDFDAPGTQLCQVVQSTVTAVGGTPAKLFVAPGYGFYERIYEAMINAKYLIDICTLFRPSGQFKAAIKNAITYIGTKPVGERPKIRFLHSTMVFPASTQVGLDRHEPWTVDPFAKVDSILGELTAGLPAGAELEIYLAVVSTGLSGWNHAKIVAVDGCRAMAGGQNLWDDHYLGPNPVFDLSMELRGSAALHAQQYADLLWQWTPWADTPPPPKPDGQVPRRIALRARNLVSYKKGVIKEGDFPPDNFYQTVAANFAAPATTGAAKVMTVGRQAQMRWPEMWVPSPTGILHALVYRVNPAPEPADDAIMQLFSMAKSAIKLCLQNIQGGYLYYLSLRRPYMEQLAQAIIRGVQVKMVVSSANGGGGYEGDEIVAVNLWMRDQVAYASGATWPLPLTDQQKTEAAGLVTRNFQCANLRFSNDASYPSGQSPRNHAKTFIVDDRIFYVGSHNLYPSNLNEFGFIVDDAAAAAIYLKEYWDQLWTYSKVTCTPAFSKVGLDDINKVDAGCFLMDLPHNKRLSQDYNNLISFRKQYAPSAGSADAAGYKNRTAVFITTLLRQAGYETTAGWVQAALSRPPFAPPPGRKAGAAVDPMPGVAAARKCINDLSTKKDLLMSFNAVIFGSYQDAPAANAAITDWLTTHGYVCTASDLNQALAGAVDQALQLWTGSYYSGGFEIADGGTYFTQCPAFDLGAPNDPEYQSDWLPGYPAPAAALPLTISTDSTSPATPIPYVSYGPIVIENPAYANGVLTWAKGDGLLGNQTAAELTFSRIRRPAMLDSFHGREVYGWIQKADGTKVSYYSREWQDGTPPDTPPATPTDTTANSNYTAIILGTLGVVALGAAVLCAGKISSMRAKERIGQAKKNDEQQPDDVENSEPVSTESSTSEQLLEMSETQGLISSEQAASLRAQGEDDVSQFEQKQTDEQDSADEDVRGNDLVDEDVDW